MSKSRLKKAIKFAKEKHGNQKRKFHDELYFEHPKRVVELLGQYTNDEDTLIAAYLHDTIEDTATTYEEILNEFGKNIADLVKELTSDKELASKMGKVAYLVDKMNGMSEKALIIKLCDRLDNVSGLSIEPRDFTQKYASETRDILKNLRRNLSEDQKELIEKIKEKINLID